MPADSQSTQHDDAPVMNRAERRHARRTGATGATAHHGADDERQAARARSERDHSGRAADTPGGRSYAFRRS